MISPELMLAGICINGRYSMVEPTTTVSETHLHQGIGNDLFDIKGYHDILRKDR